MLILLGFAVACLAVILLRGRYAAGQAVNANGPGWPGRVLDALDNPRAPWIVALVCAFLPWVAWHASQFVPVDHDEFAYLLQAQIFALGRWSSPAPPLPEFFGQAHVLVTPVLASKYPPGHSLLLAIGVLLGAPALVVFALNALRFGLLFSLARRLSDGATALLTVVLLILGNDQRRFAASFYSEVTSGAALVVCWYCLWRWKDTKARHWLVTCAFALGWIAITRPWSAIAFALPIAWVVIRDVWRERRWRDFVLAVAMGSCVVAIIPLWAYETLGSWTRTPQVEYTRDYMPFDFPHFGVVAAKPRLTPPLDVASLNLSLRQVEAQHTVANILPDAWARAVAFWDGVFPSPWLLFGIAVMVGLWALPPTGWFAVVTLVLLFVGYLPHPTWSAWTVYYFEIAPVLPFLAALGFSTVFRALARERVRRGAWHAEPVAQLAALAGCVALIPALSASQSDVCYGLMAATAERRWFNQQVQELPHQPAIVFVRYGRHHSPHYSLTINNADWQHADAWVVYEMGAHSEDLVRAAPDRHPYVFDEDAARFYEVTPPPRVAAGTDSTAAAARSR